MSALVETARLKLMPVASQDWSEYHHILADPETGRFSNLPRNPTEKRTRRVVDWMVRITGTGKGFAWMIRGIDTGLLAGCIRMNSIDKVQSCAVIGYEIAPLMWGRGYGTEALRAVVEHGHAAMDIFRLEAWTLAGNPQSDRVLLKAGFQYEGAQRLKMLLDGERFDMHMFGRLAGDPLTANAPPAG